MTYTGATDPMGSWLANEVANTSRAHIEGWIIEFEEWWAWLHEGLPVALLAGGPLDAPDHMAAGSMLFDSRRRTPTPRLVCRYQERRGPYGRWQDKA